MTTGILQIKLILIKEESQVVKLIKEILPFLFGQNIRNWIDKGPVKLIKRVKIAHSLLESVSNQFRVIISSLPM